MTNRTVLDFDIADYGSTNSLVFVDKSQYADTPSNPILEIIIPGFGEGRTVAIISSQVNVIPSNLIQGGTSPFGPANDLPDGLYWITYKVAPHSVAYITKPYLRTTILDYQWENALLTLNNEPCDEKWQRALKNNMVDFLILRNTAKAELAANNPSKAVDYYQMAQRILRRFHPYKKNNCC